MRDKWQIDTFFIPGIHIASSTDVIANPHQCMPTIMFCNPNGVLYETFALQTEWVKFYTQKGINVFLWNYWGIGRNKGFTSPRKIMQDGEDILEYLIKEKGCLKIGIHGYSMGGAVACHLAKTQNVDMIIADRTFSSLGSMVKALYGKHLFRLFSFFTFCWWNLWNDEKYLFANCYKLIACDPMDEIVIESCSLKQGLTNLIIENETNWKLKRLWRAKKQEHSFTPILNPHEINVMFDQFQHLYDLINKFASKSMAKRWERKLSTDND